MSEAESEAAESEVAANNVAQRTGLEENARHEKQVAGVGMQRGFSANELAGITIIWLRQSPSNQMPAAFCVILPVLATELAHSGGMV